MVRTPASIVRSFLEEEDLTARELAARVGTHEANISKVLSGKNESFSKDLAIKLHRLNPRRLPLSVLLGAA